MGKLRKLEPRELEQTLESIKAIQSGSEDDQELPADIIFGNLTVRNTSTYRRHRPDTPAESSPEVTSQTQEERMGQLVVCVLMVAFACMCFLSTLGIEAILRTR